jgi:diadenosine tetraphosphatase ApaH/serine/threonine PP2A family protein phosphatase
MTVDYLLKLTKEIIIENSTLVHGSPRHPIWEYVLDTHTALCNFSHFDTPYCFIGHTHLPAIFELSKDKASCNLNIPYDGMNVSQTSKQMINPGSVGQPRDYDPRASFVIYSPDDSRFVFHRVSYDITDVQSRMSTIGLPNKHILRLASGW